MERLIIITKKYLSIESFNKGFISLFISKRLLNGAAVALMGIFVPIYLYTLTGQQFYIVGGFYAVLSLAYVLALVPGAQIMNNIGFRNALFIGGVFSVCVNIILYIMNVNNVWLLLGPLAVMIVLFRVFHWVPYHVDFAIFTKSGERGRDVSIMYATIAFFGIVGPILSGYIIFNSGYSILFLIALALLVVAAISYLFIPKTYEKFEWTFQETISQLFSKKYRPLTLGMMANGAETSIALIAWPLFLFEILDGNVLEIGAVYTLVAFVSIIIQLLIGKYLDGSKGHKRKTLKVGSMLYALGWVVKIFVLSATQIFFVGLYHSITKIFTKTPFEAMFYDMSADQGHYVDEFSVLREMAVHIGRFLSLSLVAVLTLFISLKWTFLIAAGATLLLNILYSATKD